MAELSSLAPELSRRVAAMTLDMQMGNAPSPGLVGDVAKEMRRARDAHRAVSEELKRSDDFQALEYAALTAAALERRGGDEAMLERIVDLQIGGMEAFAAGTGTIADAARDGSPHVLGSPRADRGQRSADAHNPLPM